MAEYTTNVGNHDGVDPTIDKEQLIVRILDIIDTVTVFFKEKDIYLSDFMVADGFNRLAKLHEAANTVCDSDESKQTFTAYASELHKLMKYIDRDDILVDTRKIYETIADYTSRT